MRTASVKQAESVDHYKKL